jgi:hypothetical protein
MLLDRLRQYVERPDATERCDLCARELPPDHDHVLEPAEHRLTCVCGPCAVLFTASTTRKRVPRRVRQLRDFQLTDAQWDALCLPIELAFLVRSSIRDRTIACYPSPAGATESSLSLEAWDDIVRDNPVLARMEADTEALLINRVGHTRGAATPEYFVAPIDQCYKLVGLIRTRWAGLSGGADVWTAISGFFDELRRHA